MLMPEALNTPWLIKSMPVDIRRRAVEAASADDQTVAAFVAEAVLLLIDKRAGRYVVPVSVEAPTPLTPDQLTARMMAAASLQASMAAQRQAAGRAMGRATLRRIFGSLEKSMDEAEREPQRQTIEAKRISVS